MSGSYSFPSQEITNFILVIKFLSAFHPQPCNISETPCDDTRLRLSVSVIVTRITRTGLACKNKEMEEKVTTR